MSERSSERVDGVRLRRGLADAAAWLEQQSAEVNALNVFPVPDGDTGTNMSMTLQAAVREASATEAPAAIGTIAHAAAHGALLGARGNSGVILSQYLRGIARSLDKHQDASAAELAQALALGAATAQKAVIRPVEGTMLTVGRDASAAAVASAEAGGDLVSVVEAAVAGARASVARTPSLLPVLREAGVVDAGGQGLLCILEGLLRSLRGEACSPAALSEAQAAGGGLAASAEYGFCTEFLIRGERGQRIDFDDLRSHVVALGDSALVVGEDDVARVHVHTFRPGLVLEYARTVGTLHQIKIDNMQDQHEHVLLKQQTAGVDPWPTAANGAGRIGGANGSNPDGLAIVAVASGDGFADIFRSLGVGRVVAGGQTMNPSIEEILRAVQEVEARRVLVLPNNGNIVLAAKQVHLLTDKEMAVVPTTDMAQGIAAALAFSPDADLAANVQQMDRAFRAVTTGEVTSAVRAAKLDGFEIRPGQVLGLLGGKLAAVGTSVDEVIREMVGLMDTRSGQILTLYRGGDVPQTEAEAFAAALRREHPDLEVEVHTGGQPLYQYVLSLE